MNDDRQFSGRDSNWDDFSRRDFVALSIAAGVAAAATPSARAANLPVTESNVTIKTPDGPTSPRLGSDATYNRPEQLDLTQ